MRIIKFRAWDKKDKKFIYLSDFEFDSMFWMAAELASCCNNYIQQFTGLLDKNGKEIYEGDIVTKDKIVNAEVMFHEQKFCVKVEVPYIHNTLVGYGFAGENRVQEMIADLDSQCEVVGNIYENPELLKPELVGGEL